MKLTQVRRENEMTKTITADEELALMRVLKKRIDNRVKELEGEAKDELLGFYDTCGIDRRQVKANGQNVGTISVVFSKPKAAIDPLRKAKALDYLASCGLTEETPVKGWEERFAQCGEDVIDCKTGEVVDFLLWEPQRPKAVRTAVKEQEAVAALRPLVGEMSATALLEGEE